MSNPRDGLRPARPPQGPGEPARARPSFETPPAAGRDGAATASRPWHRRAATGLNALIVGVCLAALAATWAAAWQRIAFEREQALAAAAQTNAGLAVAYEQQVVRTLRAAEQVAAFVREQVLSHGASGPALARWVTQGVIRDAAFTIVSVVDADGQVTASSQASGPVNYADRAFFQVQRTRLDDRLYVSEPVLGRVSGRWQVPMSLRIPRADGSFGGVVVLAVDPARFADFRALDDLGGRGLLELTGLDGVVRARRLAGSTVFGLPAQELSWYQRRGGVAEGHLLDDGRATDGVARVVAWRTLSDHPLMVAVGTAVDDDLGPVAQRRRTYLGVAALASLAILAFGATLVAVLTRQRAVAEALQASEALFRATFHQAAMGIAHVAPDGAILRANETFCRLLGYPLELLRGRTLFGLADAAGQADSRAFLAARLAADDAVSPETEAMYRRRDGGALWVHQALSLVRGPDGQAAFLVVVVQDISQRKALEQRLAHAALHDALTGLPNTVMFRDRLARVLESAQRHGRPAGVIFLDLDGFKSVNDRHGHAAGDAVLQQAAARLREGVRAEDTVARLGGDEFGLVLATLGDGRDAGRVAAKLLEAMARPFDLAEGPVRLSCSIGIALFPAHGRGVEELLAQADAAMYEAKRAGKNRLAWAGGVAAATPAGSAGVAVGSDAAPG